jgi:hypothetical protein
MGMGKRKPVQEALFVSHDNLPRSAGHPFYAKLNELLEEAGFDRCWKNSVPGITSKRRNGASRAYRRVSVFAC